MELHRDAKLEADARQQEGMLVQVSDALMDLEAMARDMHEELGRQDPLLDDLDRKVDQVQGRLHGALHHSKLRNIRIRGRGKHD